jgi:hypothetical protein
LKKGDNRECRLLRQPKYVEKSSRASSNKKNEKSITENEIKMDVKHTPPTDDEKKIIKSTFDIAREIFIKFSL